MSDSKIILMYVCRFPGISSVEIREKIKKLNTLNTIRANNIEVELWRLEKGGYIKSQGKKYIEESKNPLKKYFPNWFKINATWKPWRGRES